ncbi:Predicted sugar kinase [Phaffia rhodozyma]|uniref:ATP-dependent (S)-NAD(P)H-hydrate dehydratase n=1 Tax=Phaffia rhodozyma TaxID=264483 RepID=A0A0F7SF45_PHARH|nr:Predicted sugar kinase [Phaffia rhodozyma]
MSSKVASTQAKSHEDIINLAKRFVPPLSSKLHKGQAGRIGVVGGSQDYTGAPFFSSMSSMRIGADLAHVICEPKAGSVIKTYSPDLIVHTVLDPANPPTEEVLSGIISRLHALVIGPGLGRDDDMQKFGKMCLEVAKKMKKWVVLDADGLYMVTNEPDLVKGYEKAILSPNKMEFSRLCEKLNIKSDADPKTLCPDLASALGNVTVIQKGATDIISNGRPIEFLDSSVENNKILENNTKGGLKRCGGQGDVLSGTVGCMAAWAGMWAEGDYNDVTPTPPGKKESFAPLALLATYAAASVTRQASRTGFSKHGRSMQTSDIIQNVGPSFEIIMGSDDKGESED